jgi:hypothetical protein
MQAPPRPGTGAALACGHAAVLCHCRGGPPRCDCEPAGRPVNLGEDEVWWVTGDSGEEDHHVISRS